MVSDPLVLVQEDWLTGSTRRKKERCAGELLVCSCCARFQQDCQYDHGFGLPVEGVGFAIKSTQLSNMHVNVRNTPNQKRSFPVCPGQKPTLLPRHELLPKGLPQSSRNQVSRIPRRLFPQLDRPISLHPESRW